MSEQKISGVVISSLDYKDNDKLIEIFSAELGKITAVLKGCKSPKAKLKFASQPFCFANFIVTKKGNFYNVINADLIESFFDITKDYSGYRSAINILEVVRLSVNQEEPDTRLLLLLINCLKAIAYDNYNPKVVLIKFMLEQLKSMGYMLNFGECAICKLKFRAKKYLNLYSGAIVCPSCKPLDSIEIDSATFNVLDIISQNKKDKLKQLDFKEDKLDNAINILVKDLEFRLSKSLKSFA